METFTINYAKTHLSRQIEKAKAEDFIIAKAGKPLANVIPFDAPARGAANRIGFMKGRSD
jgi:antitoxin (DNA-binding transcriptional repressor) of toxin-antitoxin stability system